MKIAATGLLLIVMLLGSMMPQTGSGYHILSGRIYNASNQQVQLRGVNWFGFETSNFVVHGLWARNWKSMIQQMKSLGFNAVRLPFCPNALRGVTPNGIDFAQNADLQNKNSLQILDLIVNEFSNQGMYVLLDHHRPDCNAISELWYVNGYTEQQWINDLVFVANRYKNVPRFLGLDLKNEPHGAATWGTGNNGTDWNKAAERAASAVLANAPNILIFVEGITDNPVCSNNQYGHWWGGNLEPQQCAPLNIPADRLVLSPHVYGPDVFNQPYFNAADFPNNLPVIWNQHFGQFADAGYAVVPGEFGGKYGHGGDPKDRVWQNALVDYFISKNIRSSFYWDWNPNSGDTGGILQDDWQTVWQDKVQLLQRLWGATPPPSPTPTPTPTVTPTPTPTPTPSPSPTPGGGVTVTERITSDWGAGYCKDVTVANGGGTAVDWSVRLTVVGNINNFWNGVYTNVGANQIQVGGVSWNDILQPAQSTGFGYCAVR